MNEPCFLESVRKLVGCTLVGLSREIEVFLGTSANNVILNRWNKESRLSVSTDVTAMRDGERDDDPRGVKKRGSSWRSMRSSMSTGNLNLLEVGRKMLDAWSPPRELSPPRKRSRQMQRVDPTSPLSRRWCLRIIEASRCSGAASCCSWC